MNQKTLIWIVVGIIILFLVYGFSTYNSLVALSEKVDANLSEIDNQLARAAELLPNLEATVKGYAAHEKVIFSDIAKARSLMLSAGTVSQRDEAAGELSNLVGRLLMLTENYPNLKADARFAQLMDELTGTANRITVARRDYNEAVRKYNTRIKTFPTNIVARMFGFTEKDYFKAPENARTFPKVNFGQ
ncbi:LemA family protein [Carboxydothermus hydrogenoformans]|uniref:LemA family protein n=1 Tax=Carboxydothermus hydrogenoformans (strain ATCC BAA-161 / DSM 6008 / Z-2901) TaxID=246194 RepID=Q3A9C1_CARHZ|nr:LemA family protein [Carboxydothermus hydrogenoformans]ABB15194.1 lemA family protein [Carboxydothermus hydrogenoformans Z-2901]